MTMAFVSGFSPSSPRFLGRFLPPLADGVAAHFVQAHSRPGDLVLDPFGQSPSVAVEALSLDRRVMVASSNPILRLALSLAVRPPALADLKSALTQLGDASVGPNPADRLERQVRALYQTQCAECETSTTADAFDWDAEAGEPVEKHYVCLNCGGPRQAATNAADRALAKRFNRGGPDYHVLLERITSADDPNRVHAAEALAVYPARTLAAIAVVLVKLDGVTAERETRRLLAALLVAALDATTLLGQDRPKVLAVPRHYQELNFWLALESALGTLAGMPLPDRSMPLDELIDGSAQAGIYAHAGPLRELVAQLPAGGCPLLISALPRPNQAFWTLSAVWAAWLWGRESAEAQRAVLHRRRYDWAWHARALQATMAASRPALAAGGRCVGLEAEAEPGFTAAVVTAAAAAGYELVSWALRADTAEVQLEWLAGGEPRSLRAAHELESQRVGREAAVDVLRARAEPSRWASVHFAAWCRLAAHGRLPWQADDPLGPLNRALESVWQESSTFERLGATATDDPTTGLWNLCDDVAQNGGPAAGPRQPLARPLADRVEAEVLRQFTAGGPIEEQDVLQAACAAFPGALTPGRALVLACLSSYATRGEAGLWQLRPEDAFAERAEELQSIMAELRALAGRHGYDVAGDNPQEWREAGENVYVFGILTSAVISYYLLGRQLPARRRFLVLPGGRAGLTEFKLRRDPRLRQALQAGAWTIVKFRQVRRLLADAQLSRSTLESALLGDPLEQMEQLALPE
jgi:hypothetical protein